MKEKYKYSIVTTIFGSYEQVKEIENPVEGVEYVLVTDNKELTSKTWKVIVFDDYDKIPYPDVAWVYIKFFTFNYCNSDICLYKDGSIHINGDFTELVDYFVNNKYEYCVTMESVYQSTGQMIDDWATFGYKGYTKECKEYAVKALKNTGFDPYKPGMINSAFILKQNTEFTKQIDEYCWNLLCSYGAGSSGFKINQDALTGTLYKKAYHDKRLLVLDTTIKWSPWFIWCFHNSPQSHSFLLNHNATPIYDTNKKYVFQNRIIKPIAYNDIVVQKNPLLSVVLFTDNTDKNSIINAITNIRCITYNNWECIITSNQTELQNDILQAIKDDKRFKLITQTNSINVLKNIGLKLSNGKYIIYVNANNLIGERFCEYAITEMEKDENMCMSSGWVKYIYEDGNYFNYISYACTFDTLSYEDRIKFSMTHNLFPVETVLRTEILKNINGFNEDAEYINDSEIYIRYLNYAQEKNNVFFILDECTVTVYKKSNCDITFNFWHRIPNRKPNYSYFDEVDETVLPKKEIHQNYINNKEIFEKYLTEDKIRKIKKQKENMLANVDYHITDKCNLKCVSCNHFCPLVPDNVDHKSMETIREDLQSLQRFHKYMETLTILGGEPTLHPHLNEILYLARQLFPDVKLHLVTNGTTWNRFDEWKDAIIENDVKVFISSYPYSPTYKENESHILECVGPERCGVLDQSRMQKGPLVLKRKNTNEDILNCRMRGYCCQLKDKHLYICNFAAQIDYLYEEFPFLKNYIFREGYEKIDLSDPNITEVDVETMVYGSIPALCFYCTECQRYANSANMEYVDWKKSEKRIEEWVS